MGGFRKKLGTVPNFRLKGYRTACTGTRKGKAMKCFLVQILREHLMFTGAFLAEEAHYDKHLPAMAFILKSLDLSPVKK